MPGPRRKPRTRDELRAGARPEKIVQQNEWHRVSEFLDLFEYFLEQLVPGDREPTILERFAARRMTEAAWRWDRATDDRFHAHAAPSRELELAELFRSTEIRHRLNNLAIEEIEDARRFVQEAGLQFTVEELTADDNREEVA